MPHKCLYPKCNSRKRDGKRKSLFKFPKKNELLEKWKANIPLINFQDLDLVHRFICEEHFDKSEIIVKNNYKKLSSEAIPKHFEPLSPEDIEKYLEYTPKSIVKLPVHDNDNCRFCLRRFEAFDEKITICKKIRNQFTALTNLELRSSKVYSQMLCKQCGHELKKSCNFKKNIINNQDKLHGIFGAMEDNADLEVIQYKPEIIGIEYNGSKVAISQQNIKIESELDQLKDYPLEKIINKIKEENSGNENNDIRTDHSFEDLLDTIKDDDSDDFQEDKNIFSNKKENMIERKKRRAKERVLCTKCGKDMSRASLRKHMARAHAKTVKAICDICNKHFYAKHLIHEHMRIHIGIKTYKCKYPDCQSLSFLSRGGLYAHVSLKHLGKYAIYCEHCGKKFNSRSNYETHIRSAHTGERPFTCDAPGCGKSFYSKTTMQSHKKNLHCGNVVCPTCGKIYSSGDCLRKHMKSHQDVRFPCTFENCGKQFLTNAHLKLHTKIHLGEKDYSCPHCNAMYHKKASLDKHIRSVHMKMRIHCELSGCKSDFTRKEIYRKHILSHHQNIGEEATQHLLKKIREMKLPTAEYDSKNILH